MFEREYLLTQINRFGGNVSRTATFVGMERSALHRKLKSLNVVTSTKAGSRVAHVGGANGTDPEMHLGDHAPTAAPAEARDRAN